MNHLRFLRYVDEVARAGSVRQAAERLHVAPSAVIRRIQDLEHELGTPIFERLPRGMRLTAAGELFVAYIRQRHADLEPIVTWEQKLMVMMHRSHPLARHPEIRLRDCVNYPLALPGPDLGGRQLPVVAHAFANHLQRQLNAGALPLTAPRPAAASH